MTRSSTNKNETKILGRDELGRGQTWVNTPLTPHYSTSQVQKTSDDSDEPLSANKANTSQQNISTALLSAPKYKSDSRDQHTEEEGIDNGLSAQDYWSQRLKMRGLF